MFHDQTTGDDLDQRDATFCSAPEAIREVRAGRMVLVTDDEGPGNEGDLVVAAEVVTAASITFMATHGRGLIRLALTPERCRELELPQMTRAGEAPGDTAFTVSVEAREGVTTGISAADRARTVQVAVDPGSRASDLVSPGHMFPVRTRAGGVLDRLGRAEAAVDLARMAGLAPAGVVCEVLDDDGAVARVPDLRALCARHGLLMVSATALAAYRRDLDRRATPTAPGLRPATQGVVTDIRTRVRDESRDHALVGTADAA